MTKKDYILAAQIIRRRTTNDQAARVNLLSDFEAFFAADNPRFDRARWRTAVLEGEIVERPGATPRALP